MNLRGVYAAFKASLIASSCCTIPLILALLFSVAGFGSVTAALKIPKYTFFFITAGTIFLFVSLYLKIKRRCGGTCSINSVKSQWVLVVVSIATYILLTLLIIYLILPILSEWMFSLV